MSIQTEITRISGAKASLKTAIEGKGVTVSSDAKIDAYAGLVDQIQTGGPEAPTVGIPVKFLSLITGEYLKTIFVEPNHVMEASDYPASSNLAETADHPAFTFDHWSVPVGTVIKGPRTILAYYDKADKTKSEYYCTVEAGQGVQLGVANGSIVDWGDGSDPETFHSAKFALHNYAAAGNYKVTMTGVLVCHLDYIGAPCPFHSIYAGTAAVTFADSTTVFLQNLRRLYIKDASSTTSGSSWFLDSGLEVVTIAPGHFASGAMFKYCSKLIGAGLGTTLYTENTLLGAFQDCGSLEDVILPFWPGQDAFNGCANLRHVEFLYEGASFSSNTFKGCASLETIDIPATVSSFGSTCFSGCSSLKRIEIPAAVTQLSSGVFTNCRSLKEITFNSGLQTLSGLNGIPVETLTIPDSVVTVGSSCCKDMYRLKHITLPPYISMIGNTTFQNCISLEEIDIPADVVSIGQNAFSMPYITPTNYKKVIRMHSAYPPTLSNTNAFYAAEGLKIIVPAGSLSAYQNETNWTSFAQYMEEAE